MNKYWRVESATGAYRSSHTTYDAATTVARTRARLAPQESFVVLEALLIFSADREREDIVGRALLSEAQVRSSALSKV